MIQALDKESVITSHQYSRIYILFIHSYNFWLLRTSVCAFYCFLDCILIHNNLQLLLHMSSSKGSSSKSLPIRTLLKLLSHSSILVIREFIF